ncbi:LOW QUALITY PROTEIN: hypothetical protein U9M48_008559 [Paspalum notatum var. saurae]|uniref:Integrase catalytic domain-containing protein n=1 Tax=Paspalum notatum var. saurae TaxID=547442 RepID=A0AAQ3SP97_PASNO
MLLGIILSCHLPVKAIQADNGCEFVNHAIQTIIDAYGVLLRLSCPCASPQNGKAEHVLHTLNNISRTLLVHAHMPPTYWAEALSTATYLLNRRHCSAIGNSIPYEHLFKRAPDYNNLRVFGCLCYPNLIATAQHKLAPHSTACVFLGYPSSHKGYRCLDLSSQRVIISCHVVFDDTDLSCTSPSRHLHTASTSDTSLFVFKEGSYIAYLLLYVDDIILTASSPALLQRVTSLLRYEFAMTDLGALHHFLGISVTRSSSGLFLSQRQYAVDLLQRAGMAECRSTATPINTRGKLSVTDGAPYLTLTCPDLAYAVQQVCLFIHDPCKPHLALIKRILRYVKGTLSAGLHIGLVASAVDCVLGCRLGRLSRLQAFHLRLLCLPRQQPRLLVFETTDNSLAFHGVLSCCTCCGRVLLASSASPRTPCSACFANVVYCDNVSTVYMTANLVHHRRTKHIDIDIHFVREKVALGQVQVLHVPCSHQFADIMTKGLLVQLFTDFRSSLCIAVVFWSTRRPARVRSHVASSSRIDFVRSTSAAGRQSRIQFDSRHRLLLPVVVGFLVRRRCWFVAALAVGRGILSTRVVRRLRSACRSACCRT